MLGIIVLSIYCWQRRDCVCVVVLLRVVSLETDTRPQYRILVTLLSKHERHGTSW